MNKILLWIAMLPSAVWKAVGADTIQLRAILDVKLKNDARKPLTWGNKTKSNFTTQLFSILAGLFMGSFIAMLMLAIQDTVVAMYCYFSVLTAFLVFLLLPEFPSLLLDTRDNVVLFPRPISERTLVVARLLHVFTFMLKTVVPASLPGLVLAFYAKGLAAGLLFPVGVLLLSFIVLFITNSFYLLVIRILGPEKLKKLMAYFQMFITFGVLALQFLVRKLPDSDSGVFLFEDFDWNNYRWTLAMPTYWIAALWTWVGNPAPINGSAYVAILAFVVPVLFLWVTVRFLSPAFSKKLMAISRPPDPEGYVAIKTLGGRERKKSFSEKLATILNKTPEGQAGFRLAWIQSNRSTAFKNRVYPSLAYPFVMVFVQLFMANGLGKNDGALIWMSYGFSVVSISQVLFQVTHSEQFKAAWVYWSAPIAQPGAVMSGAFRAMYIKFILPVIIMMCGLICYKMTVVDYWGIVLYAVNISLSSVCFLMLSFRYLPFSQQNSENANKTKTTLLRFAAILAVFALGGLHWLAMVHWAVEVIFLILSSGFLWLVWSSYKNTSWATLKNMADE